MLRFVKIGFEDLFSVRVLEYELVIVLEDWRDRGLSFF